MLMLNVAYESTSHVIQDTITIFLLLRNGNLLVSFLYQCEPHSIFYD